MAKYHISKDGQNFGPYSPDEIRARLDSGELAPDDFAWTDGMADWLPIRTVLATIPANPPAQPTQITVLPPSYAAMEPVKQRPTMWDFLKKDKQPAVHINVNKKGCGSGCGTIFAVILALGFIQNLMKEKTPHNSPAGASSMTKSEKKLLEGNRAILADRDAHKSEGTSIQRDDEVKAVEKQYLGKTLEFEGIIYDVKSDTKIVVEVEPSEFANVVFDRSSDELHNLQKGAYIKFTATISSFGTGILVHHDLIHANIVNRESKTTGTAQSSESPSPSNTEASKLQQPSPTAKSSVATTNRHPSIGAHISQYSSDRLLIDSVMESSPAKRAGILSGDEIILLDGKKVVNLITFLDSISKKSPGDTVDFIVLRQNMQKIVRVVLGDWVESPKLDSTVPKGQLGQKFQLGGFEYTINSVRAFVLSNTILGEFLLPDHEGPSGEWTDGPVYLMIQYKIENIGDRSSIVSVSDFVVRDAVDRKYTMSSKAYLKYCEQYKIEPNPPLTEIQAGLSASPFQFFEMPGTSLYKDLTILIPEKGLLSKGSVEIKISALRKR